MKHVYTFEEQLVKGTAGARILDEIFKKENLIIEAGQYHDRIQGFDRLFAKRTDGRIVYRVDYKTEYRAEFTGNLSFEHISKWKNGKVIQTGWFFTTDADRMAHYIPGYNKVVMYDIKLMREHFLWITGFPENFTTTVNKKTGKEEYKSRFYNVPIEKLYENNLLLLIGDGPREAKKTKSFAWLPIIEYEWFGTPVQPRICLKCLSYNLDEAWACPICGYKTKPYGEMVKRFERREKEPIKK